MKSGRGGLFNKHSPEPELNDKDQNKNLQLNFNLCNITNLTHSKNLVIYVFEHLDQVKGLVFFVSCGAMICEGAPLSGPQEFPFPSCCIPKLKQSSSGYVHMYFTLKFTNAFLLICCTMATI